MRTNEQTNNYDHHHYHHHKFTVVSRSRNYTQVVVLKLFVVCLFLKERDVCICVLTKYFFILFSVLFPVLKQVLSVRYHCTLVRRLNDYVTT